MKSTRLPALLRIVAVVVLGAVLTTWIATGRHTGWTQTSVVTMQHDEITGIDYPVRHPGFVVGLEVLVLGSLTAVTLAAASVLASRRRIAR
jgi:hypothetical protein